MTNYSFTNNITGVVYTRINRRKALKALKKGYSLVVYGRMENPYSPWNSPCVWSMGDETPDSIIGISWDEWCEYTFTKLENSFEWYNSKKPWWYIPETLVENL